MPSRRPTSIAARRSSRKSTAWFDLFGAVRIADNLDLRVRPVVFRRVVRWLVAGADVRAGAALRAAGPRLAFASTPGSSRRRSGLSMLENRPDKNPVVSQHSTLYLPIPRYEPGTPSTNLLAAAYPLGAKVTVSGREVGRARGGHRQLAGARPAVLRRQQAAAHGERRRRRRLHAAHRRCASAWRWRTGDYAAEQRSARPVARRSPRDADAGRRRVGVSATRALPANFSGPSASWRTADSTVDGGWIEVTQTLHPRVFVAARYDDQWTRVDQRARSTPTATSRIAAWRRPSDSGHAGSHPARQLHDAQGLRRRLLGRSVPRVDRLREERIK